mmetsp:Transcript_120578/g.209903  ORF Transcript_120578/g.209903 Transcript_120578/m.209903 type:complete len:830 (-) Transcript_120578:1060-3549(-)
MERQSDSRPMCFALGAIATVAACVVFGAAQQSTSLYTTTTSGVSVARAPVAISRTTAMGPRVGYPSMAAMPTREADVTVSAPVAQGTTPSVLRLAQVSAGAVFAVGAALYAASRFFKGSPGRPLSPVDLVSSYGTRTQSGTRSVAMAAATATKDVPTTITEAEVLEAQKGWGQALVNIATIYDKKGFEAAKKEAEAVIDGGYGYQIAPVLFKPTLTTGDQVFRTTREGALSYFVGGNPKYPNDGGFALKGWRKCQIENAAVLINGNTATTTGNVIITDKNGNVTKVDKTWTFFKDPKGKMRIMAHHSSLPYAPAAGGVTKEEVLAAQNGWGQALVNIATTYDDKGFDAAKAEAEAVLDGGYGYQIAPVLFKPTLTTGEQVFRTTREGALSYFVGRNPKYPNDGGFALKGWRKWKIENAAIFLNGDTATTTGNVILTDKDGNVTKVDKTWTFFKGGDGNLRIMAHHSSLPYVPAADVTEAEVLAAQQGWGEGLVNIATTFDEKGFEAAKAVAEAVIDGGYGYQIAPVLFKPTLTTGDQVFRTTREGALSYFVGGNPKYPNDGGFALKGWRKVEVENAAIFLNGSTGTSVGNVHITDKDGNTTTVDKTWTFKKDANGNMRIMAHHSSLPYLPPSPARITESEVLAAQEGWGKALVNIATTFDNQGLPAAKQLAGEIIDAAYGYQFGPVLFKPTLTTGDQTFRTTREGALSYFVGDNAAYPADGGFALKGWRNVEIKNSAVLIDGNTATTMGWVIMTDKNGAVTKVDKTWTFFKDGDGALRIVSHHSSLPYDPNPPKPVVAVSSPSGPAISPEITAAITGGLVFGGIVGHFW